MVDYFYLADLDITVARETGGTERFTSHVGGATMMMTRHLARTLRYLRVSFAVDKTFYWRAMERGATLYTTHPFNINVNRRSDGHTWGVEYDALLGGARATYRGTADGVFRV